MFNYLWTNIVVTTELSCQHIHCFLSLKNQCTKKKTYLNFQIPLFPGKQFCKLCIFDLRNPSVRALLRLVTRGVGDNYFPPQQSKALYIALFAEYDIKMAEGVDDRVSTQRYTSSLAKRARASILVLWCLCFSISTASIVSIILVYNSEAWNMFEQNSFKESSPSVPSHQDRNDFAYEHWAADSALQETVVDCIVGTQDQHKVPYIHNQCNNQDVWFLCSNAVLQTHWN